MKTLEKPLAPPFAAHVPGEAYWVGTNIHRLRRARKLTQEAVASAAGLSSRRLRDIEDASEEANPTLHTLEAISKVLGVEVPDLFKRRREEGFQV